MHQILKHSSRSAGLVIIGMTGSQTKSAAKLRSCSPILARHLTVINLPENPALRPDKTLPGH